VAESTQDGLLPRPIFERFGGSWTFRIQPPGFRPSQRVTLCLACHGHGGYVTESEADWLRSDAGGRPTLARLVERRLLVGMSHAAGDAWGNRQAQADCVAFIDGLRLRYHLAPKILLLGRSMGSPLALNLALGPLAGQVARLALLQPVVDLTHRLETNPHESLRSAFGGVREDEWADAVAPYCPLGRMRALVGGGTASPPLPPARVWQNRSDRTCRIELAEELAAHWRRAGGRIDLNILDGEGHTVYGREPIASQVAEFLAAAEDQ